MLDDPIACVVFKCVAIRQPIEFCEKETHCASAHQKRRDLDRLERAEKDRREPIKPPVNPARSRAMRIIITPDAANNPFGHLGIGDDAAADVNAFLDLAIPTVVEAVSNHVDRKAPLTNSEGKVVGEVEVLRA